MEDPEVHHPFQTPMMKDHWHLGFPVSAGMTAPFSAGITFGFPTEAEMGSREIGEPERMRVAELADALDSGSSGEIRKGSNPLSRTISPVSFPCSLNDFRRGILQGSTLA
jgi:hypothetical protein